LNIYVVKPRHIVVKDTATPVHTLKERRVVYLGHGETQQVNDTQIGGLQPSNGQPYPGTTTVSRIYGYDSLGNLNAYTEPKDPSESASYSINVGAFDALTQSYPIS